MDPRDALPHAHNYAVQADARCDQLAKVVD